MDDKTTVGELKEKVRKFCEDRDWDHFHNAKDLAIGVITEASELLEHFRFRNDKEIAKLFRTPDKRSQICDELVDVLHTVLRFAQKYDIDLTTELARKMKKNGNKYPLKKK